MPSNWDNQKPIAASPQWHDSLSINFNAENTKVITEMVNKFGENEEEVVINALTLLYTIFKNCPEVNTVVVWKDGARKHYRIPIEN